MKLRFQSRRLSAVLWGVVLMCAAAPSRVLGDVASFVWIGPFGVGGDWSNAANWQDGIVPTNDGSANVQIGPAPQTGITTFVPLHLNSLNISGALDYFSLGAGTYSVTLTLQSGGLSYAPTGADVHSQLYLPVVLASTQTWSIAGGTLDIFGNLSGAGNLTKTGAGELRLYGYSATPDALAGLAPPSGSGGVSALGGAYVGTVTLLEGGLVLGNNGALGDGTLILGPANTGTPTLSPYLDVDDYVFNDIVVQGLLALGSESGRLELFGLLTLAADTTLNPADSPIFLHGGVVESGGSRKLTVDGFNAVVLTATSAYTGGTTVNRGLLAFGTPVALPATGTLSAALAGYLGVAFTANTQTAFLDRFDKASTHGTIGLDTDPDSTTSNVFAGNLDLTGFGANARLGSGTEAKITGTITPQGADYQFGGGGGFLEVASALTGARGVKVFTPDFPIPVSPEQFFPTASLNSAPLIVLLSGANTFTGNVSVVNGALAFGPGALPGGPVLKAGQGGYISTADPSLYTPASTLSSTTSINTFVARFDPTMKNGIIGFDDATGGHATVGASGDTLNLAVFTSTTDPGIYLGTASDITLAVGAITLPAAATAYRFAGFQGGGIDVQTLLTGTYGVVIGDPLNIATIGSFGGIGEDEFFDEASAVKLAGGNTYTGGTTLYSGLLVARGGSSGNPTSALGTGVLTVQPNVITALSDDEDDEAFAGLAVSNGGAIIPNNIVLNANLGLDGLGDGISFQLSGVISGPAGLVQDGGNTVTLSAANTFAGGIYLGSGTVVIAHNTAAGTGFLRFGSDGDGSATASFITAAPVIGGLGNGEYDYGDTSGVVRLASGTNLTINQPAGSSYYGGTITGSGSLTKTGSGRLFLDGSVGHAGGTAILAGTLVAGQDDSLGSGPITLNGGRLVTANGATLQNTLNLVSGILGGHGAFDPPIRPVIGAGLVLAPGGGNQGHGVSVFQFGHGDGNDAGLTLAGGGTYFWQIAAANGGSAKDYINITGGLDITATSGTPFVIKPITLGSDGTNGLLTDFNPALGYSWTLLGAVGGITGFDAAAFTLDTSSFSNALNGGAFALSQNNSFLQLNFTPVPEPSTWAMLIAGLGLVALLARRR